MDRRGFLAVVLGCLAGLPVIGLFFRRVRRRYVVTMSAEAYPDRKASDKAAWEEAEHVLNQWHTFSGKRFYPERAKLVRVGETGCWHRQQLYASALQPEGARRYVFEMIGREMEG